VKLFGWRAVSGTPRQGGTLGETLTVDRRESSTIPTNWRPNEPQDFQDSMLEQARMHGTSATRDRAAGSRRNPVPTPSLPEHTAIDFAAPGRYFPKSVDLDARELATGSNGYVAEDEVTEAEEQMPSASHNVRGVDGGLRQNSAGVVVNGHWVEIVSPAEVNSIDAETPGDVRSAPVATRANVTSLAQAMSVISGALAGLSVGLLLIRRSSERISGLEL
jgi:hypothetical protein